MSSVTLFVDIVFDGWPVVVAPMEANAVEAMGGGWEQHDDGVDSDNGSDNGELAWFHLQARCGWWLS